MSSPVHTSFCVFRRVALCSLSAERSETWGSAGSGAALRPVGSSAPSLWKSRRTLPPSENQGRAPAPRVGGGGARMETERGEGTRADERRVQDRRRREKTPPKQKESGPQQPRSSSPLSVGTR